MAKKINVKPTPNRDKELIKELTEKIKQERQKQIGLPGKDGKLFKTETPFKSKHISNYQYRLLSALYNFMKENPDLSEQEIRKYLHAKSTQFSTLIMYDRAISDFISELKQHGVMYMVEQIENLYTL